jgi:hypothetical protein
MKIEIIKWSCFFFALCLLADAKASASIVLQTAPVDTNLLSNCPKGSAAVATLKSSFGWWEGPPKTGGQWHFLFRGDEEALTETLTNFAAIHASQLRVILHNGPEHDMTFNMTVDWEFIVWDPKIWSQYFSANRFSYSTNSASFHLSITPPQLIIFVGPGLDLAKVKMPAGLQIHDERADGD